MYMSSINVTICTCVLVSHSCLTLRPHGLYSPPGSSVHGILQARIVEWVAMPFCREYCWPRDQTQVSCIAGRFFTIWATRALIYLSSVCVYLSISLSVYLSMEKMENCQKKNTRIPWQSRLRRTVPQLRASVRSLVPELRTHSHIAKKEEKPKEKKIEKYKITVTGILSRW